MHCVDVLRRLVRTLALEQAEFTLVEHFVSRNWRARHPSVAEKLARLSDGLLQPEPRAVRTVLGAQILASSFEAARDCSPGEYAVSVASRVVVGAEIRHLALMNLHPHDELDYGGLKRVVREVIGGMDAYLLASGRYYHLYGVQLLTTEQWSRFMAAFLMPTIVVSPRYVGHAMYRGYATLRLSATTTYKPKLPVVCDVFGSMDALLGEGR